MEILAFGHCRLWLLDAFHRIIRVDINAAAGEASGKASVLPIFSNGKGELKIGNDDFDGIWMEKKVNLLWIFVV